MTILKKIEIFGFKTFPLRNEIFLKEGANIIIGPNGSGKSNILDALIWAMGETKISNLRGGKTEDIIFVGNRKRKPLASAEVSLVFSTENGEEKRILRKAFRDGESIFRIDSKRVRLKDITEEIYKLGIGDRKYFFIEQGMIGSIITMGSLEKRALIEEAAGISRYREKKKEAYRKLIEAESNLNILNNVLEEVKKELELWEKEFEKLKRYKEIKKNFRDIRKQIYFLKLSSLENKRSDLQKVLKSQWEELESLRNLQKELEKEISKLNSQLWKLDETIKNKREEYYRTKESLEIKRKEIKAAEENLKKNRETSEKNNHWLENSDKLIKELENKKDSLKNLIENSKEEYEKIEEQKNILEEKINIKKKKQNSLREEYENIKNKYLEIISRKSDITNKISFMEEFKRNSKIRIKRIHEEEERLLSEKMKLIEERKQKESVEYRNFDREKKRIIRELEIVQKNLREKNKKIKDIEFNIQKLLALKNEYEDRINKILKERKSGIGNNLRIKKPMPEPMALLLEELLGLLPYQGKFIEGNSYILKQNKKNNLYEKYIESPYSEFFPEIIVEKDLKSAINRWTNGKNNYITTDGFLITTNGEIYKGSKRGFILYKELLDDVLKKIEEEKKIFSKYSSEKEKLISKKTDLETELMDINEKEKNEMAKKIKLENEIKIIEAKMENIEKQLKIIFKERESIEKELNLYEKNIKEVSSLKEKILSEENELNIKNNELSERIKNIEDEIMELEEEYKILNNKFYDTEKEYISSKKELEGVEERIKAEKKRVIILREEIKALSKEENELKEKIDRLTEEIKIEEREVKAKSSELDKLLERESSLKSKEIALEKQAKKINRKITAINNSINEKEIERATIERDIINLEENLWNELTMTFEEIKAIKITEKETELLKKEEELKNALEDLSEVRFEAESEFRKFKEKNDFYISQKEDIENSIENIKEAIEKIDRESIKRFTETLEKINTHFNEIFKILFKGGSARVILLDESDILNTGVELKVKPPGKKLKNIQLLSGGEKALASIAFLFSMFKFKPSPICVLDEVDAPLDEANISKLLSLIKEMKRTTQFLIVTHNPKTLEIADAIYGVTMNEPGVSLVYSIDVPEKYRDQDKR